MPPSALSAENCVLVLYWVGAVALSFLFRTVRPYSSLFSSDPNLKSSLVEQTVGRTRTHVHTFFSTQGAIT